MLIKIVVPELEGIVAGGDGRQWLKKRASLFRRASRS
jgi:hypothetical protein